MLLWLCCGLSRGYSWGAHHFSFPGNLAPGHTLILILNWFITENNLDFPCHTETWHKPLDYFSLTQTTPTEFTYIDEPFLKGCGGGVAPIYRKGIKTTTISTPVTHSLNMLFLNSLVPLLWSLPLSTKPLIFWPSIVPSQLPFSSWVTLISTTMTLIANLPQNSWNCYNFSTSHNISTSPLTMHQLSSPNLNISMTCMTSMTTRDINIPMPIPKVLSFFQKSISHSALSACLGSKIPQKCLPHCLITPLILWNTTMTLSPPVLTSWLPLNYDSLIRTLCTLLYSWTTTKINPVNVNLKDSVRKLV